MIDTTEDAFFIRRARQGFSEENCEIDDDAQVIGVRDGAWVQAWVFVPHVGARPEEDAS